MTSRFSDPQIVSRKLAIFIFENHAVYQPLNFYNGLSTLLAEAQSSKVLVK